VTGIRSVHVEPHVEQQMRWKRVGADPVEDRHWLGTVTTEGLASADERKACHMFLLGNMHYSGIGGPRDSAEARRLYGIAAAQGYADAQVALDTRCTTTAKVDFSEAKRLFGLAAAQGLAIWRRPCSAIHLLNNEPNN